MEKWNIYVPKKTGWYYVSLKIPNGDWTWMRLVVKDYYTTSTRKWKYGEKCFVNTTIEYKEGSMYPEPDIGFGEEVITDVSDINKYKQEQEKEHGYNTRFFEAILNRQRKGNQCKQN